MVRKLSFAHVLACRPGGFLHRRVRSLCAFGATTNKGTTGAIGAERATIMTAEKTRCLRYGTYASIATLRQRGIAHVQAGLQLGGVPAREALRDDRHRLPGLPISGG